ncbi:hypothetical protein ABZX93_16700 [Streptomyces sp. NPDC006632]|uniref:hypothetical protein n=1 Tax=unclassified Streptomyces TaxID=2593676 RepID=UPI002E1C87D4
MVAPLGIDGLGVERLRDRGVGLATDRHIKSAGCTVDLGLWQSPEHQLASVAASCRHSDDSGPIVIVPKPKG